MQHCFCDTSHELYLWLMLSCNIVCYTSHLGDYMNTLLALIDCIYSWIIVFFVIPLTNCIYWWCSHAALFFWYFTRTVFIGDVFMQHCASDTSHELYLFVMFSWIIVYVISLRNCIYWWFYHVALCLWYLSWTVFFCDVLMQHCFCDTSQELY